MAPTRRLAFSEDPGVRAPPSSRRTWHRVGVRAFSHGAVDSDHGLVAFATPFFMIERRFDYTFAGLIQLGRNHVPSRKGTAAALAFGFAAGLGGLLMPALGEPAAHHGPRAALRVLVSLPTLAVVLSIALRSPCPSALSIRSHQHLTEQP
jgi:apolipoprotein N-acyltransferase